MNTSKNGNTPCQAILKAITDMDFADSNATAFEPSGNVATTFMDAIDRELSGLINCLWVSPYVDIIYRG